MNYQDLQLLADKSLADFIADNESGTFTISNLISVSKRKIIVNSKDNFIVRLSSKLKIGKIYLIRHEGAELRFKQSDRSFDSLKQSCVGMATHLKMPELIEYLESAQSIDDLLHDGTDADNQIWQKCFNFIYNIK